MARLILIGDVDKEIINATEFIKDIKDTEYFYLVECSDVVNGKIYEIVRGLEKDWNINNGWHGGEYYASIDIDDNEQGEYKYELYEAYIPKPNSNDNLLYTLGKFKTLGGAMRSLIKFGNSTIDNRKPIKIWD